MLHVSIFGHSPHTHDKGSQNITTVLFFFSFFGSNFERRHQSHQTAPVSISSQLQCQHEFLRKALVCSKMLFLSLCAMLMRNTNLLLCLYTLLAITVVSLFYFNRLQFTHLAPLSHPTKSSHLLMAHCPLTLYPQVNDSLVCHPKPRRKLIHPLYPVPANQSSQISHSLYPDSTVN